MSVRTGVGGKTVYELAEGPIGNTAAVTCITGRIGRARFKRYRDEHDELSEYMVAVNTPAESLVHDLLIHEDAAPDCLPEVGVYSQLRSDPEYPIGGRDRGQLRISEECVDRGARLSDIVTPEFPRYNQLIERVLQRMGRPLEEFHGYRLRMRYPPMPTIALFRHRLPDAPR